MDKEFINSLPIKEINAIGEVVSKLASFDEKN
ncbi:Uncharacterised protein [Campylobacter geochelonis]|uniref:Uncharacterized protein n=1 Tax=Campylobacter geochelonis TaxID=1780362 RepID=A0A128EBT3_9BACT|nr:Uncharacterised protein [Campylobacter geochelonis]CZE46399.1 Uncharacterised protein [Campylobacter geochelonis]CZE50643.1 Uncharacterised protein [Campylobacter geochelonis]